MTGFKSKKAAALDEEGMYLVHHTAQPKVRTGDCLLVGVCASEGHKIQAQRPWVGLTVDELITLEKKHMRHEDLSRAIEAKLKDKNNG